MGTKTAIALLLIWLPERTHKSTNHSPWIPLPNHWGENVHTPNASFVLLWITPSNTLLYIYCLSLQEQHHSESLNLVYCITCKTCKKQYVWQTKNTIAQRFSSHFFNIRHKKQADTVGLNFLQTDHNGTADVMINILDCISPHPFSEWALSLRLKIEKHWIHQLCCPAPSGLIIFD